ncbi:hypothetical protein [Ottowia sp.]|uniref:hypothetical protein n=1 Tax=Ottowia sp. TaxID=1898956 RepID=UPI0025E1B072|nr:hypothetical protein [Ottowia sp.]MBK6616368.1 hypothetical protein [Ottowia sp.]
MKTYTILNIDDNTQLADGLTVDQVEAWWKEGMNSTRYYSTRAEGSVVEVSERIAADLLKRELDANVGAAMAQQGCLSLKLDHDKRYWMREDRFQGRTHSLDAASTDAMRLMAHWLGFVERCQAGR